MEIVKTLHETTTPYDFMHKGKKHQFRIESASPGVKASFVVGVTLREIVPEPILPLVANQNPDDVIKEVPVIQEHFKLTIIDRILCQSLEKKVLKWASNMKKRYDKANSRADLVRKSLNV